jgi:NAD(P)-dependent dehydrogenase (short-subunit alcohol dehydrogenase family)
MEAKVASNGGTREALHQKSILVTGGSRGIGQATCVMAARRGYYVIVNYKQNAEAAAAVVDEIKSSHGSALAIQADLGTDEGVLRLFSQLDVRKLTVAALVNNAGDSGGKTKALAITPERLKKIFNVNFFSAFRCSQEAARRMVDRKCAGAIVNVSSVSAHTGGARYHVDYAAMKAAIESMTRGLAKEFASHHIRVNAVCPGPTDTDMARALTAEERAGVEARTPLGRMASPSEIAEGILWLLSEQASYVTGSVLKIAGGR